MPSKPQTSDPALRRERGWQYGPAPRRYGTETSHFGPGLSVSARKGGRNGLVGAGLGRAQTGDPPRHSSRRGVTSNILRNATASFRHGTI